MPRPRTGFTIYSEQPQVPNGRSIFYCKMKVGTKYQKRSTGIVDDGTETARRNAEAVVLELLKKDQLRPRSRLTLESFAPDFWVWGKCRYIKARIARDPKALGMEHADNLRRLYQKHILPVFGHLEIEKISTEMIDDFITDKIASGVSQQTVSHIMQSFRAPLSEAKRLKYIAVNPISDCMPITVRGKRKGAFTPEEAKILLNSTTVLAVWACRDARFTNWEKHPYDPWQHWALSIIGACTGRRVNEVVALKAQDIDWEKSEINFHSSIGRIQGLKDGTKTGEGSNIPMDAEILEMLKPILATDGFIFPGKKVGSHINYRTVTKQLHNSLLKIGISEKTYTERSLGYHSWRGFFNTRARAAHLSLIEPHANVNKRNFMIRKPSCYYTTHRTFIHRNEYEIHTSKVWTCLPLTRVLPGIRTSSCLFNVPWHLRSSRGPNVSVWFFLESVRIRFKNWTR